MFFDAASEVTGPIPVIPTTKTNLYGQDPNLDCLEQCKFERDVGGSRSSFIDIIRNGYKVLLWETPSPYSTGTE